MLDPCLTIFFIQLFAKHDCSTVLGDVQQGKTVIMNDVETSSFPLAFKVNAFLFYLIK